jgi:hypothetical protein
VRTDTVLNTSSRESNAKVVFLGDKMRAAMAKMVAAAKAPRARAAKPAKARGRIKAALNPARWRDGARRWLPVSMRQDVAVVLPDSAATRAAEAKLLAEALQCLAPAISRAALYGKPVTVNVANPHTAEVYRAALVHTALQRSTDRLVSVAVAAA